MKHKAWNDEEDATLVALREDGYDDMAIAYRMRRTLGSIVNRVRILRLNGTNLPLKRKINHKKNDMKVKIKKLHPDAVMPKKAYDDDFCYDVVATSCEEIAPHTYMYGIGLAFEIEKGNSVSHSMLNVVSLDFRCRSSVWKTGMMLCNSVGTIDEGYRNEVKAIFYHYNPTLPRYKVGDRIGQIKIGFTTNADFEWAEELNESHRMMGGFGSSGK